MVKFFLRRTALSALSDTWTDVVIINIRFSQIALVTSSTARYAKPVR
jgi:hypothetical protein